ncbi:Kelch-like protein 36, partial [Pteropus alecto]
YLHKDRHVDQWNTIESPEINSYIYGQLVASMNQRRVDFYLASIEDMLVAVGGRNENGALSSVETYSPKTDSWSYVAGLPSKGTDLPKAIAGVSACVCALKPRLEDKKKKGKAKRHQDRDQ